MTTHPQTPLINHIPPPPNKRRISDDLPPFLGGYIPTFDAHDQRRAVSQTGSSWDYYYAYLKSRYHTLSHRTYRYHLKDLLDIRLALILTWVLILWWGETLIFTSSVGRCDWRHWEHWPPEASPHRVVLVADPQLVDPHTYPGRPWPLSWATRFYTDGYLRKGFQRIVGGLSPQTVFFLGDLMDGGREWSPPGDEGGVEDRWRRYGQKQWFGEYERFREIFVEGWIQGGRVERDKGEGREGGERRKMVVGLPGNHDLGLGNGIRMSVRRRFNAYFGAGNRIDMVGNHTFVSVDTVSLSARGQPDTSSGKSAEEVKEIWQPTDQFLHEAAAMKARAVGRQLRRWKGEAENGIMKHRVLDFSDPSTHTITPENAPDYDVPSILLSHVPFFRTEVTPCGPLREHWPPSNPNAPDEKDNRNAIAMQYGNQYQNVLTAAVSNDIVDLVGDITHIFSGDDHDYCDIVHREYTAKGGGIREITVKSLSWAMGVRKPGFLLVSLWNPLDEKGKAIKALKSTVQTQLCLLPNQLGIFVRYAWILILTVLLLVGRATRRVLGRHADRSDGVMNGSLLPLSRSGGTKIKDDEPPAHSASSSTSDPVVSNGLSARGKPRNSSPANGYGYTPPPPITGGDVGGGRAWQEIDLNATGSRRSTTRGLGAILWETRRSLGLVAVPVGLWYLWLLRHS